MGFTGAVQPEFCRYSSTAPFHAANWLCDNRRSLSSQAYTPVLWNALDQSGISTDFGHRRNEDRPHFSIARFWRAILAASRHTMSLPPKHAACETNFVEIVRIGADALLVLKVSW